jgi:very-short-patch-repair endonuclease
VPVVTVGYFSLVHPPAMAVDPNRTMRLIAAGQHGLINRTQMLAAGFTESAISWRVKKGALEKIYPKVYLIAGTPLTDKGRLMAAYLWAEEGSAISHTSAAWLWGLHGFVPRPTHLSLSRKTTAPAADIRLHLAESVESLDICWLDRVALTSPSRTVRDLAAAGDQRLERALDQCLREQLCSLDHLWLTIDRPESLGRRGVRILRDLLVQRTPDLAAGDSDMEDLLMRIVRWGSLPLPELQYPVRLPAGVIHLDFAYPVSKLAIECDSYAWHMDREAFERDRERDAELQALGWRVLRFTWARLRYDPDYVLRQLRVHLDFGARREAASLS